MSYSKEIVASVFGEFDKKRKQSESVRQMHLYEVYERVPELKEIDYELSSTGLQILGASLQGKDGLEERIAKIKERNKELQDKRASLLADNGYPYDYTDLRHQCNKCCDQGYINGKICSCLKNALITKQLEASGVGQLISGQSFENFSLDMYAENVREQMSYLLDDLKSYAQNFDKEKANLLFVGGTGLGKTHLSTALAKAIIEKGYYVVYETATNIFSDFENDRFRDRYAGEEPVSTKYMECDLLIIDDLGTEVVTNFTVSCLYNLINTRLNKKLPIILSTNLNSQEIKKLYNDRITSRLFGDFAIKFFKGEDIRKAKRVKR